MLRSASHLQDYVISAEDGKLGRAKAFLFDDEFWTVRYLVVDTGRWLPGMWVLIPPSALDQPDWTRGVFPVRMTKQQIKDAPGLEEHKPVSRRHEEKLYKYYGWPPYWAAAGPEFPPPVTEPVPAAAGRASGDPHLRSTKEVTGYRIEARDGEIGHVEDFILDDESWSVRYVVVDTRNWLPGRKVLVSPYWVDKVSWTNWNVVVALSREEVKNSPRYDPSAPVNREYEARLYDYYGRPKYWS
jgi:hypothetical protein